MQLSRVVNQGNNRHEVNDILPKDCQHLTDRSPTVNRQSVDCGQQMSCRKLSFQKNLNKSVGQLSVRCWSTVGQLSANSRPTDRRQSADRLPTVGRLSVRGAVLHNYRNICGPVFMYLTICKDCSIVTSQDTERNKPTATQK